ncbi:MAG: gliding motility-associated protein GldE [Bacteroidaceae bacterium]|nr:gliding motility-associated protein GldE [Bacteroidaceae bacterium]
MDFLAATQPLYNFFPAIAINAPSLTAVIAVLLACVLLVVSAFVSGSEIALFSLDAADMEQIDEEKNLSDKRIVTMLSQPERLLATILIINDFVNVAIVMLLNYFFMQVLDFSATPEWVEFLLLTVVLSFLLLLFGEVMPKIYSKNYVLKFARLVSHGLYSLYFLLAPLAKLLVRFTSFSDRIVSKKNFSLSVDELEQALELTDKKEIGDQQKMLQGIIRFGDETVKDIMTSRMDMVMLDIHDSYDRVLRCAAENAYSRIPVYSSKQDDIRGVLYIKDLLPYLNRGESFRWQSLIRQPYFVPQTKKIDDLLCDFQTVRVHMAIVVDEFGGVSGLVTLEDIIEEIVGEINDEFDETDLPYERIDERTVVFDGKVLLADFYKIMNLDADDFDEVAGEADSLAGLLLEIKGEFPKLNEVLVCNDIKFKVLQRSNHRIAKIMVTAPEQ